MMVMLCSRCRNNVKFGLQLADATLGYYKNICFRCVYELFTHNELEDLTEADKEYFWFELGMENRRKEKELEKEE
jgi:hypothetical protein